MSTTGDAPLGRVAVIGDLGGQAAELAHQLGTLGADPRTLSLPDDLTVVQVGDLVHRGPDSPGVVAIVDRVMAGQPAQWVQLAGNHEALYLGLPQFVWPERLPEAAQETLDRWWTAGTMRGAAVIEVHGAAVPTLVTHAGLTQGFWRHYLGMPATAVETAAALNRMAGTGQQRWLFRPGVMVTDSVDLAAGPLWASSPDELIPSWREAALPAPFDQIHGHSSLLDWTTGRHYGDPDRVGPFSTDPVLRHTTSTVEGRRITGIDPNHGRRPAPTWGPLVLERARVL